MTKNEMLEKLKCPKDFVEWTPVERRAWKEVASDAAIKLLVKHGDQLSVQQLAECARHAPYIALDRYANRLSAEKWFDIGLEFGVERKLE